MFTKLELPILYTQDIESAKKFYIDTLGFKLDSDSGSFVSLSLGNTKIALNTADKLDKVPGHQTIVIKSNEMEKDYEELKNKCVFIELALTDLGYGKTFIFKDLDGNKIEVIE